MAISICLAMPECQYRDQIIYHLEHCGEFVFAVNCGADLLNHIHYRRFDHIIIHTHLSDYDALELVLNIRDMNVHTPITIISESTDFHKHQIYLAGANYWISKHEPLNSLISILSVPNSQPAVSKVK